MRFREAGRKARVVADWARKTWKDTARQRAEMKDEALYIGMNIVGGVVALGLIGFSMGRKAIPVLCTLVKGLKRLEKMVKEGLRNGTEWAAAAWRFREELIAEYA